MVQHLLLTVFITATLFIYSAGNSLFAQAIENGKHIERYENGKKKVKGHYLNGLKKGSWYYFNANGIPQKREVWRNGRLTYTYFYNENGRLITVIDKDGNVKNLPGCNCK